MSAETVALLDRVRAALVGATDFRSGALAAALSLVGESEHGGPNQGPVVTFLFGYWTHRLPGEPPAGEPEEPGDEGWAEWCAGFGSTCYLLAEATLALRATLSREPTREELEAALGHRSPWRKVGSLSVSRLWARAAAQGWTRLFPEATCEPGDLVFFHDRAAPEKLDHVGLVVAQEGRTLFTVEGNAGDAVRRRTYALDFDRLHGIARPVL